MSKYEYSTQEIAQIAVRYKRLIRKLAIKTGTLDLANSHLQNELKIDYTNWMLSVKILRNYALCLSMRINNN